MLYNAEFHAGGSLERVQYANITSLIGYLGGMDKSDVPFVYHHLKKGCILNLHSITGVNGDHLMFGVNYGSYRLGVLNSGMSQRIQQIESGNQVYRLTIASIEREKYLPPTAIKIELEWDNG